MQTKSKHSHPQPQPHPHPPQPKRSERSGKFSVVIAIVISSLFWYRIGLLAGSNNALSLASLASLSSSSSSLSKSSSLSSSASSTSSSSLSSLHTATTISKSELSSTNTSSHGGQTLSRNEDTATASLSSLSSPSSTSSTRRKNDANDAQHPNNPNDPKLPYKCGLLLFYHIPSTGGASIVTWLRRYASPKKRKQLLKELGELGGLDGGGENNDGGNGDDDEEDARDEGDDDDDAADVDSDGNPSDDDESQNQRRNKERRKNKNNPRKNERRLREHGMWNITDASEFSTQQQQQIRHLQEADPNDPNRQDRPVLPPISFWQYWKADFRKGQPIPVEAALASEQSFIDGMNELVQDIGKEDPYEWSVAHAHLNSLHLNESESLLYQWRQTVEGTNPNDPSNPNQRGCKMINTIMFRDPLSHTLSLHKVIPRKHSSKSEWISHLSPANSTLKGLWATNLDFFLYNKARRNPHNATRAQKVHRGLELLERHFDVVTVGNHGVFLEEVLRRTGWPMLEMPYTNSFKGELVFEKKEVENIGRLLEGNGDLEFMDGVRWRYEGYLSYLD